MSGNKHGAAKALQADALYQHVYRQLVAIGLDPRYHITLVIDGAAHNLGVACFGAVASDRLTRIVNDSVAKQQRQQADAVHVLAQFTLGGTIRTPIDGSNHNG